MKWPIIKLCYYLEARAQTSVQKTLIDKETGNMTMKCWDLLKFKNAKLCRLKKSLTKAKC